MSSNRNTKFGIAPLGLLLSGALMILATPSVAQQDRNRVREQAKALGRDLIDEASQVHDRSNSSSPGTKAGCTVINGVCVDNEELMGRGYDQSKVDRAMEVKGEKIESLQEFHDEQVKETTAKEGAARDAWETHEASERARPKGIRIISEMDWRESNKAIENGGNGNTPGIDAGTCTTTTTVHPGQGANQHIKEQHVCEIVETPSGADETICTRERVPTPIQETETKQVDAYLGAPEGQNELFCQRQTVLDPVTNTHNQSKEGELSISMQSPGLSCRRTVWPESGTSTQAKSHDATLAIDTQSDANFCTRQVWPTTNSNSTSGEKLATLTVSNALPGQLCRRWRTVGAGTGTSVSRSNTTVWRSNKGTSWSFPIYEGLNVSPAPGAAITNFVASIPPAAQQCYDFTVESLPTAANNYVARFYLERVDIVVSPHNQFCRFNSIFFGIPVQLNWEESSNGGNSYGITSVGNCDAEGTPQCPASWRCDRSAPTTINGIYVPAHEVSGLPLLYPGASNLCVEATKSSICSGGGATSNYISIANNIPAGTSSISNFQFTVLNPQAGVSVVLTQTPSPANNWVAGFKVNRTSWNGSVSAPQIRMTWANNFNTTGVSVFDNGNCSGWGTQNCPASWRCTEYAPVVINGITIDAGMAASVAPLFPGASSTCVRGDFRRVCAGVASVQTQVSIASKIDPNTTSITNISFSVLNPALGVHIVMLTAPSRANNWIATFQVNRTSFYRIHPQPRIRITWDSTVNSTNVRVIDEGNCADAGTGACPTTWQCKHSTPHVVNGITVTTGLSSIVAPLFPGARNNCVVAELSRVCGGVDSVPSVISIADRIPAGTTAIHNFAWTIQNPQNGVIVNLVEAPSPQNNWLARFSVTRNYLISGGNVQKPRLTLTWSINTTSYRAVIQESGDCSARVATTDHDFEQRQNASLFAMAGALALEFVVPNAIAQSNTTESQLQGAPPAPGHGGACSVRWECTRQIPGQINGINVTQAMLNERGSLYPGDGPPPVCLEAKYHRICQPGAAAGVTEISIASHLEPGTTTISNYSWALLDAGAGVTVHERQQPALSNNWVARFEVIRTDFNVTARSPQVRLQWEQKGPVNYEFPIKDTGDCSAEPNDGFCKTEWTCEDRAPEPTRPVKVCNQVLTQWMDAPSTSGTASQTIDLRAHVPAGTRGILRFAFAAQTNHANCEVLVNPFPPLYNDMRVTVVTKSSDGRMCSPKVQFRWDNMCDDASWNPPPPPPGGGWGPPPKDHWGPPVQIAGIDRNPTQVFLASVKAVGNSLLPAARAAIHNPGVGEPGGGWWDGGDIINEPPLFPGDEPPSCMRARKVVNCSNIWIGTECFLNSEGVEVCHTIDPDTPPNNDCPVYDEDPECELIREECTDGAMNDSGWCYVKSRLYECKRGIDSQGAAPIIRETVSCPSAPVNECWDGSCSELNEDTTEFDMGEVSARFMINQTMSNDFSNSRDPRNHVSHQDSERIIDVKSNDAEGRSGLRFADALYAMIGVGTAYAQEHPLATGDLNPFQLPSHVDPDEIEDDDSPYGGVNSKVNIGHIRFFSGKKRDCMKALGGLLNCCKKTPPEDQAPTLWNFIKKNMARSNNVRDQEETKNDDAGAFLKMLQNASHEDLQQMLTSRNETTKGGGDGVDDDENMSFEQAYRDFMKHETRVVKPRLAWYCDNDEFELAVGKQTGTCTHLGSFCQTRVLGKCIIKKDRYCCFNSPVTRILREHMRDTGIAGMGTARRPQCDGVTYDQMTRMNPDEVSTGEIQGRMAQGQFNLDIMSLTNMSQAEMESLVDGANSILGDLTRQNPTDRTQAYVDGTDHAAAYGSIMGSQARYKTDEQPREAAPGTVGLDHVEVSTTRDRAFVVNVKRTGTQGAVRIRAWTEPGTAQQGIHYDPVDQVINWGNGEYGDKKILVKIRAVPAGRSYPRQYLTLRIEKISGEAELSGNTSTKIWLYEASAPSR